MKSLDKRDLQCAESCAEAAKIRPAAPSRTNAAQQVKNALDQDPFNLQLIHELGQLYGAAGQWSQARNVLMRGRERLQDLACDGDRFDYLLLFCEANYHGRRFAEAAGVLDEMRRIPEVDRGVARAALACRVYAAAKEKQKALLEFHRAVDGQPFDSALRTFSLARLDLHAAGAVDTAKGVMERLADGDERLLGQLQTLEELVDSASSKEPAESVSRAPLSRRLRTLLTTFPLRLSRLRLRLAGFVSQLRSCFIARAGMLSRLRRFSPWRSA